MLMNESAAESRPGPPIQGRRPLKLRFPAICVAIFWIVFFVVNGMENSYFHTFLTQVGSGALFVLLFFGWWWFNRGLRLSQKAIGFVAILGLGWLTSRFLHPSVNPFLLFRIGLPAAALAAIFALHHARKRSDPLIGARFVALVALAWAPFLLFRTHGTDASLRVAWDWRWKPSAEERFLASISQKAKPSKISDLEKPQKGEWTSFRGPNRDGVVLGTSISTNWSKEPPTLVWKRPVGPAWSSISTLGRRLFTQEQRASREAVVCYDANTGDELWAHEDEARFEEPMSGIGPRGTPTVEGDRIYALGATGLLTCLEAATGKKIWQRNILEDAGCHNQMWGLSGSPAVSEGKVLVYAGGVKGLLAYKADSGEVAWSAPVGPASYSSPQVSVIDGVPQCLILHDHGITSIEVATGRDLWNAGLVFETGPRSCQPRLVKGNELVVGALNGPGTSSIHVGKSGGQWTVSTNWISKDLKPEFPDFIVHKDHVYGFDLNMLCCIRLEDGKRTWKNGRYGRGQVVLLADQELLLVSSETGDLVLVPADPVEHREIGRFKALEGKTWNSPVVRGNLIFHRNAQEMACYRAGGSQKIAQTR